MNPIFKLFTSANIGIFRMTSGKLAATMDGQPLLLLTTTGRKSGEARTVPLMMFDDGAGNRVVIGSAGGAPGHPAWYRNIEASPNVTVEVPGRKYAARAETVTGERRAAIWKNVIAVQSRFAGYEKKATGREIPVVVLTETDAAS